MMQYHTTFLEQVCTGLESGLEYLEGHLELGGPLGVAGGPVAGPLNLHRHGEDRRVHRAGLGQQAVLEARVDLVEAHQGVHGVVGIRHPPVQDYGGRTGPSETRDPPDNNNNNNNNK